MCAGNFPISAISVALALRDTHARLKNISRAFGYRASVKGVGGIQPEAE